MAVGLVLYGKCRGQLDQRFFSEFGLSTKFLERKIFWTCVTSSKQQAKKQIETLALANNIQEFCQRIQPTLGNLDFEQRRQLIELLIDRVIVDDEKVEIRYVIPTSPNGENTRFCQLRTDYRWHPPRLFPSSRQQRAFTSIELIVVY